MCIILMGFSQNSQVKKSSEINFAFGVDLQLTTRAEMQTLWYMKFTYHASTTIRIQKQVHSVIRVIYNKHYLKLVDSFCSTSLCKTRACTFYSRIQTSQWVAVGCTVSGICHVEKAKKISVSLRYSCSPLFHAPFTTATLRAEVSLSTTFYCAFKK
jgi:hypothetical protein